MLLLKKLDYLTRDQINQYFQLGSIRNTNRILYNLSDYLMSIREGYQSIYYLSATGRAYVDCEKVRKKGGHIYHTVMRNDLWLYYDCPADWRAEIEVSDGDVKIVVDAMFTKSLHYHFLEVDRTQTMQENKKKIKRYIQLYRNGNVERQIGHFPAIVWLTTSELRRKQLIDASHELPVVRVCTIEDIK